MEAGKFGVDQVAIAARWRIEQEERASRAAREVALEVLLGDEQLALVAPKATTPTAKIPEDESPQNQMTSSSM